MKADVEALGLEPTEKIQTDAKGGCRSFAIFSKCDKYRFVLHRCWGDDDGLSMNFLMLNPSTADAFKNDPTVGRCEARARKDGYSSFTVTNLFAYRSTAPAHLLRPDIEPIGKPRNLHWIKHVADRSDKVVVAWGGHGALRRNDIMRWDLFVLEQLVEQGINPVCLGQNKGGSPKHPLYLKSDLALRPFLESVF